VTGVPIAQRLVELRESWGLSQPAAAARAGIDKGQWYRYEKGKNVPQQRTQEKIRAAFDLPANFFGDAVEPVTQSDMDVILERLAHLGEMVSVLKRRDDARWEGTLASVELEAADFGCKKLSGLASQGNDP